LQEIDLSSQYRPQSKSRESSKRRAVRPRRTRDMPPAARIPPLAGNQKTGHSAGSRIHISASCNFLNP